MPIYEITPDKIVAIPRTSFAEAGLLERMDLQRLLREQIGVLAPDTLVLSEEFADWEDSRRRIDLLAIDRDANLVVIELKRTEDGGHMELQALRYAAMVSTMTLERAVSVYASHLGVEPEDAQTRLLEFLGWEEPDEERFAQDVRILLASAEFSKELTTAVLWLNQRDLDIRCVRLRPYRDGSRVLLDVTQVIPLPEADEYQVRLRDKETRERASSRPWSEEELFAELRARGSDPTAAERFLQWARNQGFYLRVKRGKERGSVRGILRFGGRQDRFSLFSLRSDGVLVMLLNVVGSKPALADGRLLAAFKTALTELPGIVLMGEIDVRPRFPIDRLRDPVAMSALQTALGALVGGIKAWYAERGIAASVTADMDDDE